MADEKDTEVSEQETFVGAVKSNPSKFFSTVLYFYHVPEIDAVAATDQGGFILTKSELEELVAELYAWYDTLSDEDIDLHNAERADQINARRPSPAAAPAVKPRRMVPGEVYLVRADNGLYKIGRSANAASRIKTLTVQLPYGIELIHVIKTEDTVGLERRLHTHFAALRKRGEWFELSADDVAWLLAFEESAQ